MKIAWFAAVIVLIAPAVQAAEAIPQISYQRHVLPNGLTLLIHEDHKAPVVAVNVWYHVGSKDERPGRTGFAHLFEHLMFNGSEHHNDEFFRPLEAAGATKMNGTTWFDRTNYFQNVPTSALDLALWLESDRMGYMIGAIDQKKLDEQRGVVQNEKRQGENQPYGKVDEIISASTYPAGHPYSWDTIGSMEDLNAASLDDVKEWFRTWYGAANAVLVIAGDVQPEDIKRRVEHFFGDIPPGPVLRRQQEWIAKMTGEKRATLQDRVPQARIYKTWNIPGFRTRDFSLLDLASDVLGSGKNSRLYKRLVYTDQTATAVSVGVGPFELGSQLQVTVTVKAGGDVRAVERALDEEMARFLAQGPTAEELARIKTAGFGSYVRSLERLDGFSGKSAILAQSEVYGGSPEFYLTQLNWVQQAKPADVQAAARRWLSDGVFVLEVTPVPDYQVAKAGADRSKLPGTGTAPALELPPLQRATLSNGLKVVLAERHNAPVVQLQHAELGRKRLHYLNRDLRSGGSVRAMPWTIGIFYAAQWEPGWLLTVGYQRQSLAREAASRLLCRPTQVSGVLQCDEERVGAPIVKRQGAGYLALRTRQRRTGLEARLGYDAESGELEFSLPVYFLRDARDAFTGGIRVDVREHASPQLSVFVAARFALLE